MSGNFAAWAFAAACAVATPIALAQAGAKPYASGDADAGRKVADKDCNACHARLFEGDAIRIYRRPDRRVTTPAKLLAQVAYCNTQLSLAYFPEEEADLAAYLDREHYQFTR